MPSIVQAPTGMQGFDTNGPLSAHNIADLKGAGFSFCIRYLTRHVTPPSTDLSRPEAELILAGGLMLSAVQHVANPGWVPSAALGTTDGNNAVAHAQTVGLAPGMNIWVDLEGVAAGVPASEVVAYLNTWFSIVDGAGFVSGLYVAFDEVLSGDELFFKLKCKHYWKSANRVPDVSHRGYQMFQSTTHTVQGVSIDSNVTKTDALGGAVLLMAP